MFEIKKQNYSTEKIDYICDQKTTIPCKNMDSK